MRNILQKKMTAPPDNDYPILEGLFIKKRFYQADKAAIFPIIFFPETGANLVEFHRQTPPFFSNCLQVGLDSILVHVIITHLLSHCPANDPAAAFIFSGN